MDHSIEDPYATCEAGHCNHDLARAVTLVDLLGSDGPYPPSQMIVSLAWSRTRRTDDSLLRRAG